MSSFVFILLAYPALAAIIIFILIKFKVIKGKRSENDIQKYNRKLDFLYSSYILFCKVKIFRNYINRIKIRLKYLRFSDEYTISRETMKQTYIALGSSALVFLGLFAAARNIEYFFIGLLMAYVVHNRILHSMIDGFEDKLLVQFEKFLGDIRHYYHQHAMVDEAIYDTISDCKYEMGLQATRMYEILTSINPEEQIEDYNQKVPNKFFKTFLALCYLLQRFGDKEVDGKSGFLTNLNHLKQEINLEMLRRKKINYAFQFLNIIALAPIFFTKPLEMWNIVNVPDLSVFFTGSYGFIINIALFVVSVAVYQYLLWMQKYNEDYNQLDDKIMSRIMQFKPVAVVINLMIAKNYSKSERISNLIKLVGAKIKVQNFYLKRILYGFGFFILSMFLFMNVHMVNKSNIVGSFKKEVGTVSQSKAEKELIQTEYDTFLIFKGKNVNYQDISTYLAKDKNITPTVRDTMAKTIVTQVQSYNNQYMKWYQFIICLIIGVLAYNIPYYTLLFRKKMLELVIEDEVMQFRTIIMMLMNFEQISVINIIEWLEQFATIFKDSLDKCLLNFENGDIEALEQLKIDEPFVPFVRLVDNLIVASDKITIKAAFAELNIEKEYFTEKRKHDNQVLLDKKENLGKLVAFIPLWVLLIFFLLLPFILVSFSQLTGFSQQMNMSF